MQKPSPLSLFFFIRRYRANSKQEAPIYLRLLIAGDTVDFSIKKNMPKLAIGMHQKEG